jgi:Uroporphyrinogen decarboxylase (URO-D)
LSVVRDTSLRYPREGEYMGLREDSMAILRFQEHEHMPIVHFGFWCETVAKWRAEGHLPAPIPSEMRLAEGRIAQDPSGYCDNWDNSPFEERLSAMLGFDFNWYGVYGGIWGLHPPFDYHVVEELPDGSRKAMNAYGAIVLEKAGTQGIPPEIDHVLKTRASWESEFAQRLKYSEDRAQPQVDLKLRPDGTTGSTLRELLGRDRPVGIMCGSLFGTFRDWVGLENLCYMQADDPRLFEEIIDTFAELQLRVCEGVLKTGFKPDFGHFYEDAAYRNGPLINPKVFRDRFGPWYREFSDLLGGHGIGLISVDCDGQMDELIPIWLENGVSVMFPIEYGIWHGSIAPWRAKYGQSICGVGGMSKIVLSQDYAAVDREVDRLRRLTDLGGFIPCPDHRIAPDAKWENVQYYTDRMRAAFSA